MKIIYQTIILYLYFATSTSLKKFARIQLEKTPISNFYFINMYIGSPQQKISMIIDTGSCNSHLNCGKCKGCQKDNSPIFYQQKSNTNHLIQCNNIDRIVKCSNNCTSKSNQNCQFYNQYGTELVSLNALKGTYYQDLISFEETSSSQESFNTTFGCIQQKINLLLGATGILGLGPCYQNILLKWFSAEGTNRKKQIAACLNQNGGFCQFGQNPNKQQKPSVRGKFKPNNNYFQTNDLQWIKFGSVDIYWPFLFFLETNDVVFDTGAHIMVIPFEKFLIIKFEIVQQCELNKQICRYIGQDSGISAYLIKNNNKIKPINKVLNSIFPNLEITLNKVTFVTKAEDYMIQLADQNSSDPNIHIYIQGISSFSPVQRSYLLGATFLKNKKIVFDLTSNYYQIYDHYNCTYVPTDTESQKPKESKQSKQNKQKKQQTKKNPIKQNKNPQNKVKQTTKSKQNGSVQKPRQHINFQDFRNIEQYIDKMKNNQQFQKKNKQFFQKKEDKISQSEKSLIQNTSYLFLLFITVIIVCPPLIFRILTKIKIKFFKSIKNTNNNTHISQIPQQTSEVRSQVSGNQNTQFIINNHQTEHSNVQS